MWQANIYVQIDKRIGLTKCQTAYWAELTHVEERISRHDSHFHMETN